LSNKINQKAFCERVSAIVNLKPGTVKAYLNFFKFKPAERRVEGRYNRPYYNENQIETAVQLIREIQGDHSNDSKKEKSTGKKGGRKKAGQ